MVELHISSKQVYILTESFKQLDAVYYFDTDSDYFDILQTCWQESKEEVRVKDLSCFEKSCQDPDLKVPDRVAKVTPVALAR